MKVLLGVAVLLMLSSLGIGAMLSHGPQLNAISWSRGMLGASDSWSQDIRLTDAPLDSKQPAVARDGADALHVVWADARSGESDIYYKKVDVTGRALVPDQRLTTSLSQSFYPSIATDSSGAVHVAWLDDRGGVWNVYYARLANDGMLTVSILQVTSSGIGPGTCQEGPPPPSPNPLQRLSHLSSLADIEGLRPSVAADSAGNAHIAWCDFRDGSSEVRYTVIDAEGRIAVDQFGVSKSPADSYNAVIRAWGDRTYLLWAERSGDSNQLCYASLDGGGQFLVEPRVLVSERAHRLDLDAAVDAAGDLRVVWSSDQNVNYDLFYMMLSPDGEPLVAGTQVTTSLTNSVHPSAAVDPAGNLHLVYNMEQDRAELDPRSEIFYAILAPDGTVVSGSDPLTSSSSRSHGASMVLSAGGLPSVVWSDSRSGPTNSEVYLRTQVTLVIADVQVATQLSQEAGQDYVPAAAAAGGIGVAVAAVLSYAGKSKFALLALPLYSRLKKEGLLNHAVRGQIFGYVNSHPGANFSQIMKELNLKNGVLAYHLNTLEREELIRSMRDGSFRRYYPRSGRDVPFEIQKVILDRVARMPGIPQGVLADELGLGRQVLDYHLDHLVQTGHLRMERRGKRNLCYSTQMAG